MFCGRKEQLDRFNDIVSRTAPTKRRVLEALAEGPQSGTELAERLSPALSSACKSVGDVCPPPPLDSRELVLVNFAPVGS